jgi:opacity protein-like surface antigen
MGTVRGRAGYLLTPNFLIYATGGLAYGRVSASGNYSLETDYSLTADSFALAFGQASGPGALVTVSANAGTNLANASTTANTDNLKTQSTVAVAGNTVSASLAIATTGPGVTATGTATAQAGTATVLAVASNQAGQSVTNFSTATNVRQTITASTLSQALASTSATKFGGTIGGGFEWKLAPNWSIKTEALYYNLGSVTVAAAPLTSTVSLIPPVNTLGNTTVANAISKAGTVTTSTAQTTRVKFDGVILRAGVNYQFNWY